MPTREQAITFGLLMLAAAFATLAIDFLRAPAWHALEALWVWWATGPSHFFIR
jgi:hypothetical protein